MLGHCVFGTFNGLKLAGEGCLAAPPSLLTDLVDVRRLKIADGALAWIALAGLVRDVPAVFIGRLGAVRDHSNRPGFWGAAAVFKQGDIDRCGFGGAVNAVSDLFNKVRSAAHESARDILSFEAARTEVSRSSRYEGQVAPFTFDANANLLRIECHHDWRRYAAESDIFLILARDDRFQGAFDQGLVVSDRPMEDPEGRIGHDVLSQWVGGLFESLERARDDLRVTVDDLTHRVMDSEEQIAELEGRLSKAQADLHAEHAATTKLRSSLQAAAARVGQLESVESDNRALRDKLGQAETRIADDAGRLEAAKSKVDAWQNSYHALEDKYAKLQKLLGRAGHEVDPHDERQEHGADVAVGDGEWKGSSIGSKRPGSASRQQNGSAIGVRTGVAGGPRRSNLAKYLVYYGVLAVVGMGIAAFGPAVFASLSAVSKPQQAQVDPRDRELAPQDLDKPQVLRRFIVENPGNRHLSEYRGRLNDLDDEAWEEVDLEDSAALIEYLKTWSDEKFEPRHRREARGELDKISERDWLVTSATVDDWMKILPSASTFDAEFENVRGALNAFEQKFQCACYDNPQRGEVEQARERAERRSAIVTIQRALKRSANLADRSISGSENEPTDKAWSGLRAKIRKVAGAQVDAFPERLPYEDAKALQDIIAKMEKFAEGQVQVEKTAVKAPAKARASTTPEVPPALQNAAQPAGEPGTNTPESVQTPPDGEQSEAKNDETAEQ